MNDTAAPSHPKEQSTSKTPAGRATRQNHGSEEATELPDGWATTPLASLISQHGIFSDGDWVESKDQDPNGEVRLIQLADIGDGAFLDKSARFLKRSKAHELRCTFLKKGDLLIARMPDPLGRACVFPLQGDEEFVTVVDVCVIRTSPDIVSSQFLQWAINFLGTRKQIEALRSGTTRKRISRKNLATVTISLPPLAEQKRIVAKVEELFSELDAGEESLRRARRQLGVYRQSLLKQAFEGKLTAEWRAQHPDLLESPEQLLERIQAERQARYKERRKEWEATDSGRGKPKKPTPVKVSPTQANPPNSSCQNWLTINLGAVIDEPAYGTSKKCTYDNGETGVLRIPNVVNGTVEAEDLKFAEFNRAERDAYALKPGDLLMIRSNGSVSIVGRCAEVEAKHTDYLYAGYLIRLRPFQGCIDTRLLLDQLSSPVLRTQIEFAAKSTSGVNNINSKEVQRLTIVLPSLPEQQEIARILDEQFEAIEQNEREIDAALKRSEALRQSILKKAFSGRLVAQDPADEPASELLARIRAERETSGKTPKKKAARKRAAAKPPADDLFPEIPSAQQAKTPRPKTDLQAGVIALAMAEHENGEVHLGHVKAEKIVHLCDVVARLDLGRQPVKDAAGPNDTPRAHKVEHRAERKGWFTVSREPGAKAYTYRRGRNFDELLRHTEEKLGPKLELVRNLIEDLAIMDWRDAELVATVHAAWNNLLLRGETPDEDAIVTEARENWHDDKLEIDRAEFFLAIAWIEQAKLIPDGTGTLVPPKPA